MRREAIATFGRADDRSSAFHNLGSRGHTLDRLIQVLIERVPAVRRHDDRKGRLASDHHGLAAHEAACAFSNAAIELALASYPGCYTTTAELALTPLRLFGVLTGVSIVLAVLANLAIAWFAVTLSLTSTNLPFSP